jgi:hypothetical protein
MRGKINRENEQKLALTRLKELFTYDENTGLFTRIKSQKGPHAKKGQIAGKLTKAGYTSITIDQIEYKAHRLAWFYTHGVWPVEYLDHDNRNKSNNKMRNLRQATYSQNKGNTIAPKNNTSGIKGVSWRRKEKVWYAQIKINQHNTSLGRFKSKNEAAKAYKRAAQKYFGEFARCT